MSTFLGPSLLRSTQGWKLRILMHMYYRKTFQDSKIQTYNFPEKHCWTRYLVFLNIGFQIHQLGKSCFSMHRRSHDYMDHAKMPPIHLKIEATVLLLMIIINATSQNSSHSLNEVVWMPIWIVLYLKNSLIIVWTQSTQFAGEREQR